MYICNMKEKIIKKLKDKFIYIITIYVAVILMPTLYIDIAVISILYISIGYMIGIVLGYSIEVYLEEKEKKFLKKNKK